MKPHAAAHHAAHLRSPVSLEESPALFELRKPPLLPPPLPPPLLLPGPFPAFCRPSSPSLPWSSSEQTSLRRVLAGVLAGWRDRRTANNRLACCGGAVFPTRTCATQKLVRRPRGRHLADVKLVLCVGRSTFGTLLLPIVLLPIA